MAEPIVAHVVDCETGEVALVELTKDELVQLEADRAAVAVAMQEADQSQKRRGRLIERLQAGTASDSEVQTALADVLGGQGADAAPQ